MKLLILSALLLTGCATKDYESYAKAQGEIARANAEAQQTRFSMLAEIAKNGTESAKVAAVMALAMGSNTTPQVGQSVQAPTNSQALQWASILVPSVTTLASINANMRLGMASSDNAARVAESSNAAFANIAGKIQAPVVAAPVMPQANVSTTTTSNANQANTTTSNANPTSTTTSSIGGSGVIGAGTYTMSPTPIIVTPTVTPPIQIVPITPPVIQITPIAPP